MSTLDTRVTRINILISKKERGGGGKLIYRYEQMLNYQIVFLKVVNIPLKNEASRLFSIYMKYPIDTFLQSILNLFPPLLGSTIVSTP